MPTIAVAAKLVKSMEQELTELLAQSEQLDRPELQKELERKAKQAEANVEQIDEWGGKVLTSSQRATKAVDQNWHDLRRRAEFSSRRVSLCSPKSAEEFASTLLWIAEKGELEDLALLKLIERNPKFPNEILVKRAERRLNERYDDLYLRLRNIFGISKEEFEQAIDTAVARVDISAARQAQLRLEKLKDLEELLQMQFEPQEIDRWLHTPISLFNGNRPINLITRGETDRISHLLIRLAEGIHY